MSKAKIAFSPGGCCCKNENENQIDGPCPGCHDYLSNSTNQDLPGIVLSQSPFLWPLHKTSPYHYQTGSINEYQEWDLTPYQNILEQLPQYKCGYWRITLPCDYDLYDPQDYFAGDFYKPYWYFYGDFRSTYGCIDIDGNLIGLPERLFAGSTTSHKVDDLFLCIAAPHVASNGKVTPCQWPVTPGTSHEWYPFYDVISPACFDMLNFINWARTRPQDWFSAVIRYLSPLTAYDPEVTKSLRAFDHPTGNHLSNVWGSATPVPPLKLNPHLTAIGLEHCQRMIQEHKQRWFTSDEKIDAYEYLSNNYKGNPNLETPICYAYGRDDRDGYSAGSFTGAAFLLDWGVPSDSHRLALLDPGFNEIGIGCLRYIDLSSQSPAIGALITTIVLGTR